MKQMTAVMLVAAIVICGCGGKSFEEGVETLWLNSLPHSEVSYEGDDEATITITLSGVSLLAIEREYGIVSDLVGRSYEYGIVITYIHLPLPPEVEACDPYQGFRYFHCPLHRIVETGYPGGDYTQEISLTVEFRFESGEGYGHNPFRWKPPSRKDYHFLVDRMVIKY